MSSAWAGKQNEGWVGFGIGDGGFFGFGVFRG